MRCRVRNSTSDPRDPRIVRPILTASVPVSCITVSDLRRVGRGAARGRMDAVREGWTERDAAVGYSRRAHARLEMAKLEGSRLEGSRRAHAELELAQLGQLQLGMCTSGAFQSGAFQFGHFQAGMCTSGVSHCGVPLCPTFTYSIHPPASSAATNTA